jgi:hypothetical protein
VETRIDSELLKIVGESFYGDQWQGPLARDLQVNERSIRRWLAGTEGIPDGVWADLRNRLEYEQSLLGELLKKVIERQAAKPFSPDHGGIMSTASDARIVRHLQNQKDLATERAEAERRGQEQQLRKAKLLADVRTKWPEVTRTIVDILQDFGTKLDGRFHFGDLGAPPPRAAAHARVTGNIGKRHIGIEFLVDENGSLSATRYTGGPIQRPLVAKQSINVLQATRGEYEDYILDLLGIEK